MASFDEFLAKQENLNAEAIEKKKQAELAEIQRIKGATKNWSEVQNCVLMLTKGKKINGFDFNWRSYGSFPTRLTLGPLALTFEEVDGGDARWVTLGPASDTLWKNGPPPIPETITFRFSGEGKWHDASDPMLQPIDNEGVAQKLAEEMTLYFSKQLHAGRIDPPTF